MKIKNSFTVAEQDSMVAAIHKAEKETSAEIRVHFENHCKKDVLDRASNVFAYLEMHKTALRNGVLIYIALKDRKMAIIGDKGINVHVTPTFWDDVYAVVRDVSVKDGIAVGVCAGISMIGDTLKCLFPYCKDDIDELSNEISFNDNTNE